MILRSGRAMRTAVAQSAPCNDPARLRTGHDASKRSLLMALSLFQQDETPLYDDLRSSRSSRFDRYASTFQIRRFTSDWRRDLLRHEKTFGNCHGRRENSRTTAKIARNCMIALRRRFIRLPLSSSRTLFLGPPQTTRQSRALLGLIGVVALLRLVGFLSIILGAHRPGACRSIRCATRRDCGRILANLARASDRACRGRIENSDHHR